MSPTTTSARDSLTSRVLPQMVLSDGSPTSLTAAPAPIPRDTPPAHSARYRFEVTGTAIITGGAGTLALSTAHALLSHGLNSLMIFDLPSSLANPQSITAIDTLVASFPSAHVKTLAVDITNAPAVSVAVSETARLFGEINHLFNFAGIVDCTPALEMSVSSFRRTIDVNTTSAFVMAQAVALQMSSQVKNPGGSIVFIASISGHRVNYPQPQASYNVSKAALLTLKSCLAAEWARYGIRVNSVSPGYMDTILNAGEGIAEARGIWARRNPMGRMGTPEELTGAVVLLSSSAGSYMNGTDIVVDGGQIVF